MRCFGHRSSETLLARYHDEEWGCAVWDDQCLFASLALESMQAGLSWQVVLRKRAAFVEAFHGFALVQVAQLSDKTLNLLAKDPALIRHPGKMYALRQNARVALTIQQTQGSLSDFFWRYVDHQPIINHWHSWAEVPSQTDLSAQLSKDLRRLGMSFVGPTTLYAFMQAVGMVDDHLECCWRRQANEGRKPPD